MSGAPDAQTAVVRAAATREAAAPDPQRLLALAALWEWAARAFWYPDAALQAALHDDGRRRALRAAATRTGSPAIGRAVRHALAQACGAIESADNGNGLLSLAEEHTALFARLVLVPPHGTAYGAQLDSSRTQDLARVASLYAAFGFQVSAARAELADHISVEAEFVAVLLAKEAYACANGWSARAARCARARRQFVTEHVGPWFGRFSERLRQHHRLGFYPAVAGLVHALLEAEA